RFRLPRWVPPGGLSGGQDSVTVQADEETQPFERPRTALALAREVVPLGRDLCTSTERAVGDDGSLRLLREALQHRAAATVASHARKRRQPVLAAVLADFHHAQGFHRFHRLLLVDDSVFLHAAGARGERTSSSPD